MDGKEFVVTALFIVIVASFGAAEECIKTSKCVCKTASGFVVDLNPLSSSSVHPRFTAVDHKTNATFFFNPCQPVQQKGCTFAGGQSSICQETSASSGGEHKYYDAGDVGTDTFSGDPTTDSLIVSYTGSLTSPTRTTKVELICSGSGSERLMFVEEKPLATYHMILYQSCTCPRSASGLSTGSVLVIIFFVFFIVYWVGGFLFMKFVRRAEGLEVIPNYEFWKELPLLIRDGATFTLRGCKGESTYEKI